MDNTRDDTNVRFTKQKLFVSSSALIPTTEKHWLQTVDDAMFWLKTIDRIRPKLRNAFNDTMGTVDNTSVRTVINSQLERCRISD